MDQHEPQTGPKLGASSTLAHAAHWGARATDRMASSDLTKAAWRVALVNAHHYDQTIRTGSSSYEPGKAT